MKINKILSAVIFACILSVSCSDKSSEATSEPAEKEVLDKIYLVRHAEKESGSDPVLTSEGKNRAEALAQLLKDSSIVHIYSTDFKRTMETAEPLSTLIGKETIKYDPLKLDSTASILMQNKGNQLVVGHSNTTPQLVDALGGEPGNPINEANEYNRIYVLSIDENQVVSTIISTYGNP